MKILKIDERLNFIEVVPQTLDDLWHLSKVLEKGDLVSGSTDRKIKGKEDGDTARRIRMYMTIDVEEVEFHKTSGKLRISGKMIEAKPEEFFEANAYHSLDADLNAKIKIQKKQIKKWHIDRLEKARKANLRQKLLAVILDDEVADFFVIKEFGFELKATIHGEREGKAMKSTGSKEKYFSEIVKKVKDVNADKVIFAGPGFTKNDLQKYIDDKRSDVQAHFDSLNSVGATGINELLKSGIVDRVVSEFEIAKEMKMVEKVFEELAKDSGLATYGEKEVEKAVNAGAVEKLLITENLLMEKRDSVERIMENAEKLKGTVHIISNEHEAGDKLKSLGGVAALLRYKL